MPGWGEIPNEIQALLPTRGGACDVIHRKYLVQSHQKTGRAIISCSSRWVQPSPGIDPLLISLNILDIWGLIEVMKGITADNVDLVLHSPGGALDATEPFVAYLRSKSKHVRVIVPHVTMSVAATISCAADEIVMGKYSFLGPIDPQLILRTIVGARTVPAQAILEQFKFAQDEITENQAKLSSWIAMLNQYGPGLLISCKNTSEPSKDLTQDWLEKYTFQDDKLSAQKIATWLLTHSDFKTHSHYLSRDVLESQGLKITKLEDDQVLQDLVLSVHHTNFLISTSTASAKIIENHLGKAFISHANMPGAPMMNTPAMVFQEIMSPPMADSQ